MLRSKVRLWDSFSVGLQVNNASLQRFKKFLVRESFRPGWVGFFTNPFYLARKELYNNIHELAPLVGGRVLDVGCGIKPYKPLFHVGEYLGLELDTPTNREQKQADIFYDGHVFPFDGETFDTVVANQVLEHVFEPNDFVREIYRVLRVNGSVLLSVPFLWDEHEQPADYGRYTSFGLKHLLEKHGFAIREYRKTAQGLQVHCQLLSCYLFKQVNTWNPVAKFSAWVLFSSPLNFIGEVVGRLLPSNRDLYLDNIVFATKVRLNQQQALNK